MINIINIVLTVIALCVFSMGNGVIKTFVDFSEPVFVPIEKCNPKRENHIFQENIVLGWISEMGGDKEKALSKFTSVLFDIMDGNDENTIDVLSYNLRLFTHYIYCGYMGPDEPKYLNKHMKEGKDKISYLMKKYPGLPYLENSVVLTSQGIDVVPPKVREYIKNRDIIDAGAFEGDSMVILQNYTDQHIYGYEPSKKNFDRILKNIENWNFNKTKNVYLNYGLGDKNEHLYIHQQASASSTVKSGSDENRIEIVTLGDEIKKRKIKLGSIKADTEGYTWPILLGAMEDILRERPVFLIQLYHCYDEYVRIPRLLKEMGNYIIQYRADHRNSYAMDETQIIGYPAEIVYPHYDKM